MTSAALIFVILGKHITLKERLIIKDALNMESLQGIVLLTIFVGRIGPLTMLYAMTKKLKLLGIRYPEGRILIG